MTSQDQTVSFRGIYSPVTLTANDRSVLYLGAENKLYWPSADETIGAFRAYFQLSKGEEARQFVLNFDGENTTTILSPAEIAEIAEMAGAWYDLQGRRVERSMFNVPRNATLSKRERSTLQKGVYIRNGRKVVVK